MSVPGSHPADRYRPSANVMFVTHGSATVLLDVEHGRYFSLDEIGGRIWQLLHDHDHVPALADALADEYDAPLDALSTAITELLERLSSQLLVDKTAGCAS